MRNADPFLQGALSLDEVAEVAVLLIPDWCLEGEQFDCLPGKLPMDVSP
jgi:hypothetical protein